MASALVALGGNVGDVRATFRRVIAELSAMPHVSVVRRSSDYATPPWGDEHQARFINACVEIDTTLDPLALLAVLHQIERKHGRNRADERRWGPRTLDLDLLAYDDVSVAEPKLALPHPRMAERAFVLVPLAEIALERTIAGRRVDQMLADVPTEGIDRLPDTA